MDEDRMQISDVPGSARFAEGMLLVTTLIWGGTFGATKLLLDDGLDPMALLAWRFGIATLCFLPFLLLGRFRVDRQTLRLGAALGVLLFFGFGLQTFGLVETTSSRSGFITALYVIFTPLLQPLFGRDRPGIVVWSGVGIVLAGLWMLTGAGSLAGMNVGDLLTLGCALAFAVYIVLLDRSGSSLDPIPLAFVQVAVVTLLTLGSMGVVGGTQGMIPDSWIMPTGATPWLLMLYLALLATVFTTWCQTRYQPQTTPSRAAIIFTMESVFAAIVGVALLGDLLGLVEWIGGGLIVAGLLLVELVPTRVARRRETRSAAG